MHSMDSALGFDFGEARIGVAVGNKQIGIAHPVCTIAAIDNNTRFKQIETLIKEWQPQ